MVSRNPRFGVRFTPNCAWRVPYEEASVLGGGETREIWQEKIERGKREEEKGTEREWTPGRNRAGALETNQ